MSPGEKAYGNSTEHRNSLPWARLTGSERRAWEEFAAKKLAQYGRLPKYGSKRKYE